MQQKYFLPPHDHFSDEQGSQSEAIIMTLTCTVKDLTCSRIHRTTGIHHYLLWRKGFIILYYVSVCFHSCCFFICQPLDRNFLKGGITDHILLRAAHLCCGQFCRYTAGRGLVQFLVRSSCVEFACSPQFSLDTLAYAHSIKTRRLG